MANVTLHGPAPSSYVRTSRMTLIEKGVDYDLAPIDFGSDALLALHPFGKVPILEHGDVTLYETQAIVRYIDAAFDGPSLVPEDHAAMGLMEQWISVLNCYFYRDVVLNYCFEYIRPKGEDGAPHRGNIEASLPDVERAFGLLDKGLDGKNWLAGSFSLADLMVAPVVSTGSLFPEGGQILDRFGNLRRWLTTLEQRDSGKVLYPPKG